MKARETVARDTPAFAATSPIVIEPRVITSCNRLHDGLSSDSGLRPIKGGAGPDLPVAVASDQSLPRSDMPRVISFFSSRQATQ